MTWRAYLIETMTGRVGKRLDIVSGSGSIPLLGIEDLSISVPRAALDDVEPSWYEPDLGGILITREVRDLLPETPIMAGPILDDPTDDRRTVTFSVGGLGSILEDRVLLARDYGTSNVEQVYMRRSKIALTGNSLGGIMREIIHYATSHKPNGYLPIVFDPSDPATGSRVRTYEGWNLANNVGWKRLIETAEVINGPDFAFRPEWVDSSRTKIRWRFVHGTESQPRLAQTWTPVFDATADGSPVASMTVRTSTESIVHRVYATGSGEGAGTKTVMRERRPRDLRTPLREIVVSDTSAEGDNEESRLAALAEGTLNSSRRVRQITLETVANAPQAPFGQWCVGDLARVSTNGWLRIPDGDHDRRIISTKFDLGTEKITVELQEDPAP